jgi:hypothetical protein
MHIFLIPHLIPSIRLHGFPLCACPLVTNQWGSPDARRAASYATTLAKARYGAIPLAISGLPLSRWHAKRKPRHKGCIILHTDRVTPWRVAVHQRALVSPRRCNRIIDNLSAKKINEDWAHPERVLAVHNSKTVHSELCCAPPLDHSSHCNVDGADMHTSIRRVMSCHIHPMHRRTCYARYRRRCFIRSPVRLVDHLEAGCGALDVTFSIPSQQPSLFRGPSWREPVVMMACFGLWLDMKACNSGWQIWNGRLAWWNACSIIVEHSCELKQRAETRSSMTQ